MKNIALITALLVSAFAGTSTVQAKPKLGKLAGTYKGSGSLIDNRQAPANVYKYSFAKVVAKVAPTGTISGSAMFSAAYSFNGSPFFPISSPRKVTVSGKISKVKITKTKITATGFLKFSDGTQVDGSFSVAAKNGKGTFKIKDQNKDFKVNFLLKK